MSTRTELGIAVAQVKARELMEWVTAELRTIVTIVDGVSDSHTPTMELLEAGDAVRFALVRLIDWSGARGDAWGADPTAFENRPGPRCEPYYSEAPPRGR
jgi:hypothetical protein